MPPALTLLRDHLRDSAPLPDFVEAMSMLASGVVLVTSWVGGRPWGTTVTAFASVSAEPPTILVSLGSATTCARAVAARRSFGVSILAEEQLDVAHIASDRGATKFIEELVERDDGSSDSPVAAGALAHLDCRVAETVEIADHTIFFGRVRAAQTSCGGTPLLYHRRSYRRISERNLECHSS
jgi:flavin reductase (DIM6/NTAB) family NADH-FMN oxidoreductase RutF